MMDPLFLLKGLAIGFVISTPLGPVGVLCLRRIFTEGRVVGFVSGLGAASADTIFGALAAFGLTFIYGILMDHQWWIRMAGGMFLLFVGIRIFLARPSIQAGPNRVIGLLGDFASVFFLALSNPMIILSMAAMFAAFNLTVQEGGMSSVLLLLGGVFTGSAAWWIIMSLIIGVTGLRFEAGSLRWINRIAGTVITGFGLLVFLTLGLRRLIF